MEPLAMVMASISEKPPGAWSWLSDSCLACLPPRWRLSDWTRAFLRTTVELNWSESASGDQHCAAA
jgi:hypothetical protein